MDNLDILLTREVISVFKNFSIIEWLFGSWSGS